MAYFVKQLLLLGTLTALFACKQISVQDETKINSQLTTDSSCKSVKDTNCCFSNKLYFCGLATGLNGPFECQLLIQPGDSVRIVLYSVSKVLYSESKGEVIRINDSIYYFQMKTVFASHLILDLPYPYIVTIETDSNALKNIPYFKFIYCDETADTYLIDQCQFMTVDGDVQSIELQLNKEKINDQCKEIRIDIGHRNLITNKKVTFRTPVDLDRCFITSYPFSTTSFYATIVMDSIKSINSYLSMWSYVDLELGLIPFQNE